jgi:pyrroline-5-carboxylate reductase
MVNTPALVGETAGAYALGERATDADAVNLKQILDSIGVCHKMEESQLDAVTGLAGSGPAYIFMLIEALADGGVKQGIPRKIALELATQTVYGASKMVKETRIHPAVLKDAVASPGGTTIYAMHALETNGFRDAIIKAVEAGAHRSKAMSGNM